MANDLKKIPWDTPESRQTSLEEICVCWKRLVFVGREEGKLLAIDPTDRARGAEDSCFTLLAE